MTVNPHPETGMVVHKMKSSHEMLIIYPMKEKMDQRLYVIIMKSVFWLLKYLIPNHATIIVMAVLFCCLKLDLRKILCLFKFLEV